MSFVGSIFASRANAWHRVPSHRRVPVAGDWQIVALSPDSANAPARAFKLAASQQRARILATSDDGACTVATALAERAIVNASEAIADDEAVTTQLPLDDSDWWFRTEFIHDAETDNSSMVFEGLASLVDVWLNGVWLGRTNNMFMRWEADVSALLAEQNELVLCARAMSSQLQPRRPRARWRARLLGSQEWRWHRTTHMGRMPGFGPATPPVGPWRAIAIEHRAELEVLQLAVRPQVHNGVALLSVDARVNVGDSIQSATVVCGETSMQLRVESNGDEWTLTGELTSGNLQLWWPHTHGTPRTYPTHIDVALNRGDTLRIELGEIGFRSIALDTRDNDFAVAVNEHQLFLRGVCWNPRDWARVDVPVEQLDDEMLLLTRAGINCIRLAGCFTYPSHDFLAACDRHGILVWQDLMFSVLDYPEADAEFVSLCEREARQVLTAMQSHACLAVVCGSAEVAQQAAMMGVAPTALAHSLFRERLAAVAAEALPGTPYWSSTPWGGALPFEVRNGTAHYFGVGAYKRDLHDARRSAVKFATECLAFAHVPEPESLQQAPASVGSVHGSEWKRRIPRDGGASWDFEDVRDHYVERFFGESAALLRETDPNRYLALGRAASAIAVERTMQEFRRDSSTCNGALMWLWGDAWMGAGWGCIDSTGRPKSAWYALRRASKPIAIALSNEGMNGADVHLWNDSPQEISGTLLMRSLQPNGDVLHVASRAVTVAARSALTLSCDDVFGRFTDVVHAYQFGMPAHDVVHALWLSNDTQLHGAMANSASRFGGHVIIDEAALLPLGDARIIEDTGLRVEKLVRASSDVAYLTLSCERTTSFVRVGCTGWIADDSYFTLVPGVRHIVALRRIAASVDDQVSSAVLIEGLNCTYAIRMDIPGLDLWLATASASPSLVFT